MAETIRIEIPIETVNNTDPELANIIKSLAKMTEEADKADKAAKKAAKSVTKFDDSAEKTQKNLASWMKENYEVLLEAKDKVSPILNAIGGGLKGFAGKTWNVTMKAVDLVTSPVRGILNLLKNPILQAGAVLGVSIGVKDAVDTYKNFEATMSRVKALSDATGADMERLNQKAKDMGANTKFSATESAEAFTYMSQAGWGIQDMLDGITGVMSLAASDGLDLATTTDIVSNALTAFGLTAKDTAEFADVLAIASSASNTDVASLGEAFKYVAPVAGALKYSIQDVSLALGVMSNNSINGSMAGTALKTALANMAAPTDNMAAAMQKYGISLTDGSGNMKTLRGVIDNLRGSLGGLSEAEQTAAASTIFGKEAMSGMLGIINTSEEKYKGLIEQIDNSSGAADRMANTMQENIAGVLEQLGGSIETVKISWMERLAPYIAEIASAIVACMPAIENLGLRALKALDRQIVRTKEKIADFTSTDEWRDANIFGKISIAWNELIAQPFSEWWESTGHAFFVAKAASIGRGIGKGITMGLMGLLGISISGINSEGESIGNAFAKGFVSGTKGALSENSVDGMVRSSGSGYEHMQNRTASSTQTYDSGANPVMSGLGELTKGVFARAGRVLPGGKEADLSAWISAALLAKAGSSLFSLGGKGVGLGQKIAGSGIGPAIGRAVGSYSLAGEVAPIASSSGLLGMAGNAGVAMGATATTGAGMAALGAAGITGGLVGGISIISGAKDAFRAYKSDDHKEKIAYGGSAGMQIGGALTGAAAGAAIGSVVPVVGTAVGGLIGAGIGGTVGTIMGNKTKENYEKEVKAAKEAADALALAQEQAKYESQDLKDALADASITAEEFGEIFQKAVGEKLQDRFGDIKLSMTEIESLAKDITFGDSIDSITRFTDATADAQNSLNNLQSVSKNMNKLNWKAGLGLTLDENDIENYKSGIDALLESASEYLEDKHYEVKAAIDLWIDPDSGIDMTSGTDAVYALLQDRLNTLGAELQSKAIVTLEDGTVSLNVDAEVINLKKQIAEITQKVSDAEIEADSQTLKIKHSGAALDAGSFADLQTELQEQAAAAAQSYEEALNAGISSLNLQKNENLITPEEYDGQIAELTSKYQEQMDGVQLRVESFQLDSIVEAFRKDLDGVLPELQGSLSDKFGLVMQSALKISPDAQAWTTEDVSNWFGLDGLQDEVKEAIAGRLTATALTIPTELDEALSTMELPGARAGVSSSLSNAIAGTDMLPIISEIDMLKSNTGTAIDTAFSPGFDTHTQARVTLDWTVTNPTVNIPFSGGGTGSATVSANIAAAQAAKNANGDIINSPLLSWVGEDGPEVIIPVGGKRRSRGLSLWERAGELLGVRKYANGGFVGGSNISSISSLEADSLNYISEAAKNAPGSSSELTEDDYDYAPSISTAGSNSDTGNTSITVEVSVSPTFEIAGGNSSNGADILSTIQSHIKEIADDIGGEIANQMEGIYSNMPQKA